MKFTKIPTETFKELQLNAGVLLDTFSIEAPTFERTAIIGATSGGIKFEDKPEMMDFGEDIDNCPKNTKQLTRITRREITLSGTFISMNAERAASLMGASTTEGEKITPKDLLDVTDFKELWWVGDYSDKNGETNGGYIAINIKDALSTGGFSIQTGDESKGQFPFTYTCYYDLDNMDTVPYDLYIHAGTAEA